MDYQDTSFDSITPDESISNVITAGTTITSNDREPPKPTKARPAVCWYFFYYPEDTSVAKIPCYVCKKAVTFNKASSTSLTFHAKKHAKMYRDYASGSKGEGPIQTELAFTVTPRYDVQKSHDFLVQWIISDSQAFRAGENPFFQQFLESLHFDYKALKKDAVIQRTMRLFDAVKLKISDTLAKHHQKVSLTLDIWTSPSQDPFLCVTLHLIDQSWVLKSQVIAFRYIPGTHTGVNIATVLEEILKAKSVFSLLPWIMLPTMTH
jgi:hypothetical protein